MITNFNTNFLLVWIFRVNCGQSGHGQSGHFRFLMKFRMRGNKHIDMAFFVYLKW